MNVLVGRNEICVFPRVIAEARYTAAVVGQQPVGSLLQLALPDVETIARVYFLAD